jgi:hypothetical protein
MGLYECQVCGKKYRSAQWLSRHVDAKHGTAIAAEVEGPLVAAQAQDVRGEHRQRDLEASSPPTAQQGELLALACQDLGIEVAKVLSYHIYDERVVLIEGPAGRKRAWPRKENG